LTCLSSELLILSKFWVLNRISRVSVATVTNRPCRSRISWGIGSLRGSYKMLTKIKNKISDNNNWKCLCTGIAQIRKTSNFNIIEDGRNSGANFWKFYKNSGLRDLRVPALSTETLFKDSCLNGAELSLGKIRSSGPFVVYQSLCVPSNLKIRFIYIFRIKKRKRKKIEIFSVSNNKEKIRQQKPLNFSKIKIVIILQILRISKSFKSVFYIKLEVT